jgi:hypothetical protein
MRALLREVLEISGKINDDIEKKKKKKRTPGRTADKQKKVIKLNK